ncbi:hypothetical protein ACWDTI_19200 [Gordonia sp. NPDC003424]
MSTLIASRSAVAASPRLRHAGAAVLAIAGAVVIGMTAASASTSSDPSAPVRPTPQSSSSSVVNFPVPRLVTTGLQTPAPPDRIQTDQMRVFRPLP